MQINIMDFDSGVVRRFSGDESDILQWLHVHFPETRSSNDVEAAVAAVNDAGYYQVEIVREFGGSNLLPDDYLTHNQKDAYPNRHLIDGTSEDTESADIP